MEQGKKKMIVASRESCEQGLPGSNSRVFHLPKLMYLIGFMIKNKQKPTEKNQVFLKKVIGTPFSRKLHRAHLCYLTSARGVVYHSLDIMVGGRMSCLVAVHPSSGMVTCQGYSSPWKQKCANWQWAHGKFREDDRSKRETGQAT